MISVILPSYNSEGTIAQTLDALLQQNFEEEYEIILCDSSRDRTPEIVRSRYPMVKYHHFAQKTDPGTARNKGVEMSSGELILFIDSDCQAEPDWMARMVALHRENPDVAAIGGCTVNGNDPEDDVAWAGYIAEFREFFPGRPGGFVDHIPTMNISYKRWVFDELGGFDPHFYPQEDLKFNFYLRQAGHRILFDPAIRVHHTHRSTYRAFLGHQERIGKINSQVLKLLPLSGAGLARNKGLFMLLGPFLPFVKLTRTFFALLTQYPSILFKHPGSWMAFTIGVFYWFKGFAGGVFSPPLMENKGE